MAARLSPDVAKLIKERIRMHPLGKASDISASLELDGIKVAAAQIQRLMKRAKDGQTTTDLAYQRRV